MALTDKLTAIADAIRTKTGTSDTMTLDEMATAVGNITGDGETTTVTTDSADAVIDKSITEYSSDTLTSIGDYVFRDCANLTSINTPNVTSIGIYGFYGCTGLTSADVSACTSLGTYAFNSCRALTDIDVSSVTSLGTSAFAYCSKLQTISIPNVTSIPSSAFSSCTALTTIDLSNVTSIGDSAFSGCTYLGTADTSKVESIGSSAFYYCTLTSFDLSACTNLGTKAFHYCTALRKVWLPSTCTTISASIYSYSPFYKCSSTLEIYTDVADEDSIPEGWGTYWNYYGSGSTLTVHYGANHDEYEAA